MKNQTLNEEISRIKSVMGILNEQNQDNFTDAAKYIYKGYRGGGGMGTYEEYLTQGFEKIKSLTDYQKVEYEVIQYGGYKSLVDVINGEFGSDDIKYIQRIQNALRAAGINAVYSYRGTPPNHTFSEKSFVIKPGGITTPPPAATTQKDITCITFPNGQSSVNVKTKSGYDLQLFNNNRFQSKKGAEMGDWTCTPNDKCSITFEFDKDKDPSGKVSIKYTETMLGCGGPVKPKMQWVKNNGFPLKFGEMTGKYPNGIIGKFQVALNVGMSGDGYFGRTTEKFVKAKFPNYVRETGVTEEMYNSVVTKPYAYIDDMDTPESLAARQANQETFK